MDCPRPHLCCSVLELLQASFKTLHFVEQVRVLLSQQVTVQSNLRERRKAVLLTFWSICSVRAMLEPINITYMYMTTRGPVLKFLFFQKYNCNKRE